MKFIIHSKSEEGFWLNGFGWSYCAMESTQFTEEETRRLRLPISKGNDAEWMVFDYAED